MKLYKNLLFVLLLFAAVAAEAQAPHKFSYQAVVRNQGNALVVNRQVGLRFTILQGGPTGFGVYSETHQAMTNINGLVSVEIGGGTPLFNTIANINWANGPYFLKTETDPNGGFAYTISGTTQMLSVPYALYAETSANPGNPGYTSIIKTEPIYPGTGNCRFGGTMITVGLDLNRNQVLDTSEINRPLTRFVCNGKDGKGITNTVDNGNGTFTFYYSDGTSFTTSDLRGPQGPIGLTGPQGATGATGPQGPIGLTGPQGATGPQGPIGLTGPQGATGPQGPIGQTGPQGATGAQGPIGLTGPQGPAGTDGVSITNSFVQGDSLYVTLSNGQTLNTGYVRGPQGATGATGAQGATGPQGPIGLTGPTGAIGPQGPQGVNGVSVTNSFVQGDSLYVQLSNGQTLNTGYVRGPQGFLMNGNQAGNTPFWNGSQWVLNGVNFYNNGSNLGIGTTNPDLSSITEMNSITQGFLPPRMTNIQRDAIVAPANGLIIFNTSSGCPNYYSNGTWYEWCGTGVLPNGIVGSLSCGTTTNNGSLSSGVAASGVSSVIPYTGGNGGTHNGQTVTSIGVSGLTATLTAGTFANGAGTLTYTITGTPATSGTASFSLNIGGQTCVLTRTVALPVGTITALSCGTATNSGTLTQGIPASGVSSSVPYTGGNGGTYYGQTVASTGVTGLTATLAADTLASGNGSLTFNISGIPCSSGTANFTVILDSIVCTFSHTVLSPLNIGDFYQGGYVAYIYQQGDPGFIPCEIHGFVVAPNDLTANTPWGCRGTFFNTSSNLGQGRNNTIRIVNGCSEPNIAAKLCFNLVLNGYSDWWLPSRQELQLIYNNRASLPNLSGYHYWSSSDCSIDRARVLNFVNGGWFNCSTHQTPLKDAPSTGGTRGTRPIRYF